MTTHFLFVLTFSAGVLFADPPHVETTVPSESQRAEALTLDGIFEDAWNRIETQEKKKTPLPHCQYEFETPINSKFEWNSKEAQKKSLDLASEGGSTEDLLNILASTKVGRQLVAMALPRLRNGRLKILPLTAKVRKDFDKEGNVAAFFWLEGGTIFIPLDKTVGENAITLFHEMVHALDDTVESGVNSSVAVFSHEIHIQTLKEKVAERNKKFSVEIKPKDMTSEERKQFKKLNRSIADLKTRGPLLAERRAYEGQYLFEEELARNSECAGAFVDVERARFGKIYMSDDDIVDGYGLDAKAAKRILRKEEKKKNRTKRQ